MYVNLKFKNSKMFNFCLWFMLSTKQSQMENVAGNTLRKWQRCNFLELDTDWATHENIIYIHILWTFVHIPIYRGAHTPYIMGYIHICRRQRTLCEQKGRNEKSQKKRTTRHNVFYFIIMTTTCLCMCVHTCAYYCRIYVYI